MGQSVSGIKTITIIFPQIGTFKLKDLEVWCQPMDEYSRHIAKLGEEVLENIETDWNSLRGTIDTSKEKLLCVSIPWLEGWKAYVDGEEVELYHANTAFMALELPEGEHNVVLKYWLPGLTLGLVLSALGVVALIGVIYLQRKRMVKE